MRYGEGNKITANIKCPYFISLTEKAVSCEGVDTAYKVVLWFKTKEDKEEFIKKYCCEYPTKCPIASAIDEKYRRLYD